MQLDHAMTRLEAAIEAQLRIALPEIADAGASLLAAMRPAVREAMMEAVSMAVDEIGSQLPDRAIDLRLVDGDPELVVRDEGPPPPPSPPPPGSGDDEARITLRLPGYLKDLIADEAAGSGDSVNSFLVDLISTKAARARHRGARRQTTIDL